MTHEESSVGKPPTGSSENGAFGKTAGVLASLKLALAILVLLALACIVGTILPQGANVAKYLAKHPDRQGVMDLLSSLGMTHVYTAWWFLGLLCMLSISLAACSLRRLAVVFRVSGQGRLRAVGSFITHISMLLILGGGVIRGVWGEKGYVEFREGQSRDGFHVGSEHRKLPFKIRLVDFDVQKYEQTAEDAKPKLLSEIVKVDWPEAGFSIDLAVEEGLEKVMIGPGGSEDQCKVRIIRRVMDFVRDASSEVGSRSDEPRNPAVLVEYERGGHVHQQWVFAKYPDFNMHTTDSKGQEQFLKLTYNAEVRGAKSPRVKDWKSTLEILEGDAVMIKKTIEVNVPLSYKGYTFYQSGYNPRDPSWTSLQVVKDPGVPLVYAGFALMIIGLVVIFVIYPAGVDAKAAAAKKESE
jgi:hypothetical protein